MTDRSKAGRQDGEALRVGDIPREAATRHPDKLAIITPSGSLSFGELDRQVDRFAAALQAQGLGIGDSITLWGENDPSWVVAYYGAARAGCIVNPVNALLTAEELRFIREDVGSSLLVTSGTNQSRLDTPESGVIVYAGAAIPPATAFDAIAPAGAAAPVSHEAMDTALICYTSGTTGHPKGAMLSHRSVLMNAQLTALMHGRRETDVVLSALPLAHVYGNVVLNASMLVGATLVLLPRFDVDVMVDAIATHRPTMIEAVPTMYHHLLASDRFVALDHSHLRICTVGGQTMPLAAMKAVEAVIGCPLIELWGMTELAGLGATHPHTGPRRLGSIGTALPFMEIRVADRDDPSQTLPAGKPGELLIRGPLVMNGYVNRPQDTSAVIGADGWLRTGDIAVKDDDGFVQVVDRKSDMILCGGYNIYPAEVERVLAEHPAVLVVAVGPVPDPVRGEAPRAYVVLKAGFAVDADEIIGFARKTLAAYKAPRSVRFVPDLPRTSSGKIMRRALCTLDNDVDHKIAGE